MQSELIENERLHNAAQLGGTYICMYMMTWYFMLICIRKSDSLLMVTCIITTKAFKSVM